MRTFLRGLLTTTLVLGTLFIAACDSNDSSNDDDDNQILSVNGNGNSEINQQNLNNVMNGMALEPVSQDEETGLVFMREEEKMARDVYLALFDRWGTPIFRNIASAEQTHTGAIQSLLDRYDIDDPMIVDELGEFEDQTLQELHDSLVLQGRGSLIEALIVGMTVEEIDILDLERELTEVVDNKDITLVYENLLRGSGNHLRAFYSQLTSRGVDYQPQYLSIDAFITIVETGMDRGGPHRN